MHKFLTLFRSARSAALALCQLTTTLIQPKRFNFGLLAVLAAGVVVILTRTAVLATDEEKPQPLAAAATPAVPVTTALNELSPGDVKFFEDRVRPLLTRRCLECHAADSKLEHGNLLLDSRPGWQAGGDSGNPISAGKPDQSLLVTAISYADKELQMPPKGKLPQAEIDILTEWVKRGAPDPRAIAKPKAKQRVIDLAEERKHWAYQPLLTAAPPEISDVSIRTDIDKFWLAKLRSAKLQPASPADRRTLIRRAYFTMLGLPPSPEEIDAFINDAVPDAWERVVERLLGSPQYGERWGRHWLDLARFGESHGFEHDYDRTTAYHYRDFAIKALNSDLPYADFVRWQIAGDELAPQNPLAMMATGFLAAGVHATQITANQVEKERYDELDDIVATIGTSMLGLTLGCARCHDHKYDPLPVVDYYRMVSTFTTTVRSEQMLNLDPDSYLPLKEKFDRDHQPFVQAAREYEQGEMQTKFAEWLKTAAIAAAGPQWLALKPEQATSTGDAKLTIQTDGVITAGGANPDFPNYAVTFKLPAEFNKPTALRLDALSDPALVHGGPGRASNGNFSLTDFQVTLEVPAAPANEAAKESAKEAEKDFALQKIKLELSDPQATFNQSDALHVKHTIDGDKKSAWAIDPEFGRDHAAIYRITNAPELPLGGTLTVKLEFQNNNKHSFGRFRIAVAAVAAAPDFAWPVIPAAAQRVQAKLREQGADKLSVEERAALLTWFQAGDERWRELTRREREHAAKAPQPKLEKVLISSEGVPAVRLHTQGGDFLEKTHLLKRGDPNQKLSEVETGFLTVLGYSENPPPAWRVAPPAGAKTSFRRTAFANWLTDTEQGAGMLLARVIVNRVWYYHFGRGIVATPSDFGKQGSPPSHAELLDFLARDLIANGWRLKPLHRQILLSAAFQQSAQFQASAFQADPDNTLIWRWTPRRLEAEAIRDSLLAVSGQLDSMMYGPGTLDDSMRRRSIYFTVKRSKLIPMLQLFDAPDANQGLGRRSSTTVAPQALWLMNNSVVREFAAGVTKRVLAKSCETPEEMLRRSYRFALGRAPSTQELAVARAFWDRQTSLYAGQPEATIREAALTDFCQVLLSLNEFVYVE